MRQRARPRDAEVALRLRAVDGAATRPETARRFRGVVRVARGRRRLRSAVRRSREREEGARLVERRAQRRRAGAVTDDVEQVAVRPIGRIGPLPRRARAAEPHEERAPARAVEVARDPVAALAAAMREVLAADRLGAKAERGGDAGRVHGAAPAGWHGVGMGDSSGPEIDAPIPAGPNSCRRRRAKHPARSAGARHGRQRARSRLQKEWGADAGRRRLPEAEGGWKGSLERLWALGLCNV